MALTKTVQTILAHPLVESISDERRLGDGFWVYLKTGWIAASMECGSIHEGSPSACLKVLRKRGNIIPDPRGPHGGTELDPTMQSVTRVTDSGGEPR